MRSAAARKQISPDAVAAYAELLLKDDQGKPLVPEPHHMLWLHLMCNSDIKQLLIIAPPESAKTTWSMAFLGLHVGVYPEEPVMIGSISTEVAERRSLALRSLVETPEWQMCFPGVQPVRGRQGLKWETFQWSVAPNGRPYPGRIHPSVTAVGQQAAVIGSRARIVFGDDILDYNSTRTEHQRLQTKNWAYSSFFSRTLARVGRKILIGNAWHHDDLYAEAQNPANGWVVCHTPMLSPGNEVYATMTYPDDWDGLTLGQRLDGIDDPYRFLTPTTEIA